MRKRPNQNIPLTMLRDIERRYEHKQVVEALTKLGLEVIETEGKEFDPNFHDAVMQTPTSDKPEHTIINELQKGYKMGDKVLRPALVNVATSEG